MTLRSFALFLFLSCVHLTANEEVTALRTLVLSDRYVNKADLPQVKSVECVGLSPMMVKPLKAKLKRFLGKPITNKSIQNIKDVILKTYENNGHPIVIIQVPPQNIKDGILIYTVTEATVGGVAFKGNNWTKTSTLEGLLNFESDEPINQQLLLNSIEFLNKNPFRSTRATYRAGAYPGTTDVTLYLDESPPYRVFIGGNNNGIPETELTRFYTGFTLGNLFFQGHVFTGQFTTSADFKDLLSGTAAYMAPMPSRGLLSLYGGFSTATTTLITDTMKNNGYTWQVSGRYTFPLNTSAFYAHEFLFGIDFKRLNSTIEFTSSFPVVGQTVSISEVVLSYFGSYVRGRYAFDLDIGCFLSPGDLFAGQSDEAYHTLNPFAESRFLYGKISFMNRITLPLDFLIKVDIKGQGASATLLAPETFGLGGQSTVRGYYERTYNGDNGVLTRGELLSPSFPFFSRRINKDQLCILGFVDYGLVYNWKQIGTIQRFDYLFGAGPGLRYRWSDYVSGGFDYGFNLHDQNLAAVGRPYVWLTFSY